MNDMSNKWIGKSTIRPDGAEKVTGRAAYAADTNMPGMIWGKVLRSPHPHARIISINTAKAEAHPGVKAVAVVGRPDPEWGESVVAFVVSDGAVLTEAELDATCLERIARYKRPKEYRFVEGLPTNNYGKVLKRELREQLQAESLT